MWGPALFPDYFDSLLHPFFCSLLPMSPDARIQAVNNDFPAIVEAVLGQDMSNTTSPQIKEQTVASFMESPGVAIVYC